MFYKSLIILVLFCGKLLASYSFNLLWENSSLNNDQLYFCGNKDEASYQEKCLLPMLSWAKKTDAKNPMYIWFDSLKTSETALRRAEIDGGERIKFRDIQEIPLVRNSPDIFSSRLPVYFRSDLLRVIVAHYLAKTEPHQYIVYADFNVPALSEDELFDKNTLEKLDLYGFVLSANKASDYNNPFENAFFIYDKNNSALLQSSQVGLIDINMKRAEEFLKRGGTKKSEKNELGGNALCKSIFSQVLWVSYKAMFQYYLYLQMTAELNSELEELKERDQSYNNPIIPYATRGPLMRDSSIYYEGGFGFITWRLLFKANGSKGPSREYYYIHPYSPKDKNVTLELIRKEKLRRMQAHKNGSDLFSVHNTSINGLSFWQPVRLEVFEGSKDRMVSLISLGEPAYAIPTKDVNKPISSFYGSAKPVITGDDC